MKEKIYVNKILDEKGSITTDTTEIQRIIREYFQNLFFNKLGNPKEIDMNNQN
jgi:hypothetical protein